MRTLTEAERAFLENPFVGVVTDLRPDGSPHSTIVWVDVDDEGVRRPVAAEPKRLLGGRGGERLVAVGAEVVAEQLPGRLVVLADDDRGELFDGRQHPRP